ncbi:MAG TPA: pilus assembly protein PilM [Planctomycetota bacterium]|nr:pilus assembly protein PilM [Planctomycetota bacterium]
MKSAWGFDISKSSLKAVRLELRDDNIEITDFDVIDYGPSPSRDEAAFEQDFRLALNTFRSRHKIKGETIVVSPPFHNVFNRFVNLPAVGGERLHEIVKYEAQQHLPFAIEEVIWSYQKIERAYQPGEEIEVVFFAVKRELIEQCLGLVTSSGLRVDEIQFAPVALYNYIMADYAALGAGKNFVILDIGTNNTNLILVEGNKFWIRNIPIVGNDITKSIQQKLEIPFEEAERLKVVTTSKESPEAGKIFAATQNILKDLASEIHRSIGFYKSLASGRSVNFDKIILMGNASRTIYFEEFVSQRLQIATVKLSGLGKLGLADEVNKTDFSFRLQGLGVALGLALQGLGKSANKINLLPPEVLQRRAVSRRKPFVAAIAAILILIPVLLHLSARKELDQLAQINEQVKETLDKSDKVKKTYNQIKDESEKIKQLNNLAAIGGQRDIWIKIVNNLNKLGVFTQPSIMPPKGYVDVDIEADEQYVKEQVQNKIWVLEVKIGRIIKSDDKSAPATGGDKLEFVNMEITCGLIARQKSDGEFDPVSSQTFIKDQLVKPLLAEFNIPESASMVNIIDSRPVGVLMTEREIKEIGVIAEEPRYYRFQVNIQIPVLK